MGFFDKFKSKEDKFDKQIAELQAKTATQEQSKAETGDKDAAQILKKAEDNANNMNAFVSFAAAETPLMKVGNQTSGSIADIKAQKEQKRKERDAEFFKNLGIEDKDILKVSSGVDAEQSKKN